ncbi:MAG TPA: glycosyltransferase [Sediminibacterium sp.]
MNRPFVSVVIPTYNRAEDLQRALQSVQTQTYTNWEVIVVDNHSTDNTDYIIEMLHDARIFLYKIRNNGIIAASRNLGIQKASGKLIALLDSDDWWTNEKLEKSVAAIESGADLVYHDLWMVTAGKKTYRKVGSWPLMKPVYDSLLTTGNPVINSSVVVRKTILEKIGGISESPRLIAAEDFDCWLRIALITDRFTFLPDVLGYYWHGTGNTSNFQRSVTHLAALKEMYMKPYMDRYNTKMPAWFQYNYGRALFKTGRYSEASRLLTDLVKRATPMQIKIKSLIMLIIGIFTVKPGKL